jgi:radical SAM superfamily enzyme YgiQ (UPF0313 family)
MKVLLIQPPNGETIGLNNVFLAEPLALELVAASLEFEHTCSILDMRLDSDLDSAVKKFRPDACGISCSFTPDVTRTIQIASRIKVHFPSCFVFVGGHHASQRPSDFSESEIDAVIFGDGEESSRNLLKAVEEGASTEGVPSVMTPGRMIGDDRPQNGDFPDIASMSPAARHLVARYRDYYQMGLEWPIFSVETARGCPYRCSFCSVWELYGGKRRERNVVDIVEELASIDGKHIFFTDDLFFFDADRAKYLAMEIKQAGIRKTYTCQARADRIVESHEAIRLWKDIGLKRIFIGLESKNESLLKSFNKGYGSKTNERAIEVLHDLEIAINGQFIVEPNFSVNDFRSLLDYAKRKKIEFPSFTILTPLPGTSLYRTKMEELVTEDTEMFDLFHSVLPTRLPLERFYEEFARLYRESYFTRPFRFPTYRILRYVLSPEKVKRFLATTKNLRELCNAETYLKAHGGP